MICYNKSGLIFQNFQVFPPYINTLNVSEGSKIFKDFYVGYFGHNLVDFSENDYLGTIEGFRDIKPDTLECIRQKPAIPFKLGVQLFYEKSPKWPRNYH